MGHLEKSWTAAERASGLNREQWKAVLSPVADLDHTGLAQVALSCLKTEARQEGSPLATKNLEWWAQPIAVTFEEEIGRRVPGQRCDGSFGASGSKTVVGHLDDVAAAWAEYAAERLPGLVGEPWAGEPRISETQKWRYWRCELANGAPVSVNMCAKGEEKSSIAFEMRKLNSADQSAEFKAAIRLVLADFVDWRADQR